MHLCTTEREREQEAVDGAFLAGSWGSQGPACSVRAAGAGQGGSHTVKMLERLLDCLRMGVGVEEAAMVSMRSSRWLMLGVEGTEEE